MSTFSNGITITKINNILTGDNKTLWIGSNNTNLNMSAEILNISSNVVNISGNLNVSALTTKDTITSAGLIRGTNGITITKINNILTGDTRTLWIGSNNTNLNMSAEILNISSNLVNISGNLNVSALTTKDTITSAGLITGTNGITITKINNILTGDTRTLWIGSNNTNLNMSAEILNISSNVVNISGNLNVSALTTKDTITSAGLIKGTNGITITKIGNIITCDDKTLWIGTNNKIFNMSAEILNISSNLVNISGNLNVSALTTKDTITSAGLITGTNGITITKIGNIITCDDKTLWIGTNNKIFNMSAEILNISSNVVNISGNLNVSALTTKDTITSAGLITGTNGITITKIGNIITCDDKTLWIGTNNKIFNMSAEILNISSNVVNISGNLNVSALTTKDTITSTGLITGTNGITITKIGNIITCDDKTLWIGTNNKIFNMSAEILNISSNLVNISGNLNVSALTTKDTITSAGLITGTNGITITKIGNIITCDDKTLWIGTNNKIFNMSAEILNISSNVVNISGNLNVSALTTKDTITSAGLITGTNGITITKIGNIITCDDKTLWIGTNNKIFNMSAEILNISSNVVNISGNLNVSALTTKDTITSAGLITGTNGITITKIGNIITCDYKTLWIGTNNKIFNMSAEILNISSNVVNISGNLNVSALTTKDTITSAGLITGTNGITITKIGNIITCDDKTLWIGTNNKIFNMSAEILNISSNVVNISGNLNVSALTTKDTITSAGLITGTNGITITKIGNIITCDDKTLWIGTNNKIFNMSAEILNISSNLVNISGNLNVSALTTKDTITSAGLITGTNGITITKIGNIITCDDKTLWIGSNNKIFNMSAEILNISSNVVNISGNLNVSALTTKDTITSAGLITGTNGITITKIGNIITCDDKTLWIGTNNKIFNMSAEILNISSNVVNISGNLNVSALTTKDTITSAGLITGTNGITFLKSNKNIITGNNTTLWIGENNTIVNVSSSSLNIESSTFNISASNALINVQRILNVNANSNNIFTIDTSGNSTQGNVSNATLIDTSICIFNTSSISVNSNGYNTLFSDNNGNVTLGDKFGGGTIYTGNVSMKGNLNMMSKDSKIYWNTGKSSIFDKGDLTIFTDNKMNFRIYNENSESSDIMTIESNTINISKKIEINSVINYTVGDNDTAIKVKSSNKDTENLFITGNGNIRTLGIIEATSTSNTTSIITAKGNDATYKAISIKNSATDTENLYITVGGKVYSNGGMEIKKGTILSESAPKSYSLDTSTPSTITAYVSGLKQPSIKILCGVNTFGVTDFLQDPFCICSPSGGTPISTDETNKGNLTMGMGVDTSLSLRGGYINCAEFQAMRNLYLCTRGLTGTGDTATGGVCIGASFIQDKQGPTFLKVTGTIYGSSTITAGSDIRIKRNIVTVENALDKVNRLRGVNFTYIENNTRSMGVIAQEIQEVIPEVVSKNNGTLGVNYGALAGLFIEAIKEMNINHEKEINELKSRIEILEELIKI